MHVNFSVQLQENPSCLSDKAKVLIVFCRIPFFLSFVFFAVIVSAQKKQPARYIHPLIASSANADIYHDLGKMFLGSRVEDNKTIAYKDSAATSFFKGTKGVIAMDGGFTITLKNGKILWLFGDSYIDHYDSITQSVPCLFQARNSALLQPSANNLDRNKTISLVDKKSNDKTFLKDTAYPIMKQASHKIFLSL